MQRKLTDEEIRVVEDVRDSLATLGESTGPGPSGWHPVHEHLFKLSHNKTSDGKPWVEPEKAVNDDEHGRLRDLAIDAAVHRLIMAQHPTLAVIEIQRRCRTECVPGSCVYTIFFDNKLVAKIDLISPRRFAIEIQESKEKA